VLDKQSRAEITKLVRDTIGRVPPRPVAAHTIGTATIGKSLSVPSQGLSVGGVTQPKITTQPISLGPPPNPVDGDIWIATGVDANGTRWQFQYNAGSTSALKWEFIGGAPLFGSSGSMTVTATGAVALTGGPSIAVPRTGDYEVDIANSVSINSASSQYAPTQLNGSVAGGLPISCSTSPYTGAFAAVTAFGQGVLSNFAPQTLNLIVSIANGTVSTNFGPGMIRVVPRRIS
jgi:hypothetical protein